MTHLVGHLTSGLSLAEVPLDAVREYRAHAPAVVKREYAYVTAQAWMNESGYGTHHYLGARCASVEIARGRGFEAAGGTDDFLVATIVGDELTDLSGASGEELADWPPEDFAAVAAEVGLAWRASPPQAGPKPAVKRSDLHDVTLSALAHLAGCTGHDRCGCDVDTDLAEGTARSIVTSVVTVLRQAGVEVEDRVGDAWDVAPSGACGRCCPPNDAGCGHECHQQGAGVPF